MLPKPPAASAVQQSAQYVIKYLISKACAEEDPELAQMRPAIIPALRSLGDGKSILRKPYATSSRLPIWRT